MVDSKLFHGRKQKRGTAFTVPLFGGFCPLQTGQRFAKSPVNCLFAQNRRKASIFKVIANCLAGPVAALKQLYPDFGLLRLCAKVKRTAEANGCGEVDLSAAPGAPFTPAPFSSTLSSPSETHKTDGFKGKKS